MGIAFVIQPFDGAEFDQRYRAVLAPAISNADLEPYRVDQDPNVAIPIEHIEWGIQRAEVCIADISLDNPNVWTEVGLAIGAGHNPVLICRRDLRSKFPFDVQHRSVILYDPTTPEGLSELKERITDRVRAILYDRKIKAEYERKLDALVSSSGRLNDPIFVLLAFLCLCLGGIAWVLHGTVRDRDRLLVEVTEKANEALRPTGVEIRWAVPLDLNASTPMDQVFSRSPQRRSN